MNNSNFYGILVEKYGKRRLTTKERVMIFDEKELTYYPLPDDKPSRNFLKETSRRIKSGEKRFESINDFDLSKYKKSITDMQIKPEKIPLEKAKLMDDSTENNHYTIRYSNIEGDNEIEWEFYMNDNEFEIFNKIQNGILEMKNKTNKKNSSQKKIEESQTNKTNIQGNQFTNYKFVQNLEIIYQSLWTEYIKEYTSSSKKASKLIELELSIQLIVNEYTKYCERLAKIILSYLKKETFKDRNKAKIIPIIFESILESETKDHYLIYYFFGITITMTWGLITYRSHRESNSEIINNTQTTNNNIRNSSNYSEDNSDLKIIEGTWSNLKANFLNSQSEQNNSFLNSYNIKGQSNRVPLTCIIDYCGFRFLCEYDFCGVPKNLDSMKIETKREIKEIQGDLFNKCWDLFNELFSCNDNKKDSNQKEDIEINKSIVDGEKKQNQEKKPYEKLFDVVNDYFNKIDSDKDNPSSGSQSKNIFFYEQKEKYALNNNKQRGQNIIPQSQPIDYIDIKYNDFKNNLTEYPEQNYQVNEILFHKNIFFRPELLSLITGKDNTFNEAPFHNRRDSENKKDNIDNNKSNDLQSQMKVERLYKEKYLNIFVNSLDSFYFKIYDSESFDNLLHSNGINIASLGYIADKAKTPFIKEFCLNEMLARTCKKIIFHILAEDRIYSYLSYMESLPTVNFPSFPSLYLPYKYQKLYNLYEIKSESKVENKTEWSYFKYLKETYANIGSASSDLYKFYFNLWDPRQNSSQKNNDENVRNDILNINNEDKKNKLNENDIHNQNKKQNNIIPDDHIPQAKKKITLFLNVLFNHTKERIRVKGKLRNHKELWNFLTEEIKNYYKVESKEILLFCKLKCMSIPPFLKAFEYHSGINLYWGNVKDDIEANFSNKNDFNVKNFYPPNSNLNYTNRHLMNIVWKPEYILDISSKKKTFSFSHFLSNENKSDEYICNYSQFIINRNLSFIDNFDKYMLLRYYYEKITKKNAFSTWYVVFFHELKRNELLNEKEISLIQQEKTSKNDSDEQKDDKVNQATVLSKKNECLDLYKYIYNEIITLSVNNPNTEMDLTGMIYQNTENLMIIKNENSISAILPCPHQKKNFMRLAYIMINISKEIQEIMEKLYNGNNENNSNNNLSLHGSNNNYFSPKSSNTFNFDPKVSTTLELKNQPFYYEIQAIELISNFYILTHPYLSDIKQLIGKELLKKWKITNTNNQELENLIEKYFKESTENGLKCLSKNNIYLANLSLDAGTFYAIRNDYINAVKIFKHAYIPFKQNSQDFPKDYYMFLKRFIKYNIKLGDYKTALDYGDELIQEHSMFRGEKDSKIADYIHKNLHLERVIYNLALVALKIKDYDKGLKHCQNIFLDKGNFSQINSLNNDPNNIFFKKKKTEYVSWMRGKEYDYPCRGLENEKDYDKKVKDVEYHLKLKLYLKMIIRSLKDDNKNAYLSALLRIFDSSEEKKEIKRIGNPDLNRVRSQLEGKGDLGDYFRGKILVSLKNKNRDDDIQIDKMQNKEKEQNSDYESFRILYCYFKNDNVFYSFIDKKDPKYMEHDDDIDFADRDNMEEEREFMDEEYEDSEKE